uniref:ATP-dependent RNA helicase n=1 Tax=Echinococcus granulosus TaxID=6210 RepID=A0A068WVF9_ECHGR|nr:ATP dependent RNA helicase DDX31 [Echinococcus granulosus]
MDGDCVLNIKSHESGGAKVSSAPIPKKNISSNVPIIPKEPLSNGRGISEGKIGRAIRVKKSELVKQLAEENSPPKKNVNVNVRTRGLKFPDESIAKNPLQVGLSAKQHSEQQDLLNVMSEGVTPNIESVFSKTSWGNFGSRSNIHPRLISIIQKNFHFERPTSIQVSAIKHLLDGCDALIKAQTGSGKTVAYALPLIHNLMETEPPISRNDGPKALIILPTRELATQTGLVMTHLCRACVRIVPGCLIGGAKRKGEKASLRKGLNIIVSTPRRLLDHIRKTAVLSLKGLRWLVIDEADRLVELGFERDVRRIIERVTREVSRESPVQTVLLSATLTPGVETLAGLVLKNPVKCEVADDAGSISNETTKEGRSVAPFSMPSRLKHFLLVVPCKQRLVALAAFLLLKAKYSKRSGKLIVFLATQDCVDFHHRLFSETLCKDSDNADGAEFQASDLHLYRLHGNMDHKERQTVFQKFSSCPNGILLTTDVASRGLDLAGVAWVVQYHVSGSPVDYVHRVGRTARAGGRGKALLLLQPEEESYTRMLSTTVGLQLQRLNLTDVLQTALYHLRHTKGRRGVRTVEEAAASMGKYFLQMVDENAELLALAEQAYLSFLRAYASFSGPMREHFVFKRLHLGHVACAFCLRDAPSDIASRVTGKRPLAKSNSHPGIANSAVAGSPIAKRSRRLEFLEENGEVGSRSTQKKEKTTKKKPRPAELATRNMLAEYGL